MTHSIGSQRDTGRCLVRKARGRTEGEGGGEGREGEEVSLTPTRRREKK